MDKKNMAVCGKNPKGEECDVVRYADDLLAAQHEKNMKKMTEGKQKGYTKTTVEGIVKEQNKP